jgi:hypothetical protein
VQRLFLDVSRKTAAVVLSIILWISPRIRQMDGTFCSDECPFRGTWIPSGILDSFKICKRVASALFPHLRSFYVIYLLFTCHLLVIVSPLSLTYASLMFPSLFIISSSAVLVSAARSIPLNISLVLFFRYLFSIILLPLGFDRSRIIDHFRPR